MKEMNKRAAMELSISTIVVIVLAMSMLILGLVLVKNIFSGAQNVVDMNQDQLENQISKMYGEDQKLVIYPSSQMVEVTQGESSGFGFGIKNLNNGSSANVQFSYSIVISGDEVPKNCGVSKETIMDYMVTPKEEAGLSLASGELTAAKVIFQTDVGAPLCMVRFRINTFAGEQPYASGFVDVEFVA